MTSVSTRFFAVELPGAWQEIKTADPTLLQYRSGVGSEQLSITTLPYSKPIRPEDVQPYLEQYLQVRRKTETDVVGSANLELTPVTINPQGTGVIASYNGFQPAAARRFLSFTVSNAKVVVTFYYEALDTTAADFDRRKREVLGSVKVAD